jgi:hypothetical protein
MISGDVEDNPMLTLFLTFLRLILCVVLLRDVVHTRSALSAVHRGVVSRHGVW